MKIEATFVRSAAGAGDLPRDGLPEIAMVGRSNVGKSSLINALVRQKIARTSSTPGKTRLANIYRVERPREGAPFYLVDLPGYGYARGRASAGEFQAITAAYFGRAPGQAGQAGQISRAGKSAEFLPASPPLPGPPGLAVLLLVDARHPGLANDIDAWQWMTSTTAACAVAATKIDKLASGERIRSMRELESVLETSVLPVSAVTGEGLDELWILIDRLANSRNSRRQPRNPRETGRTVRPKNPPKR